jgi:hypothetical protein
VVQGAAQEITAGLLAALAFRAKVLPVVVIQQMMETQRLVAAVLVVLDRTAIHKLPIAATAV